MNMIINDNYDGQGMKISFVHDPLFDGPIERYQESKYWTVEEIAIGSDDQPTDRELR